MPYVKQITIKSTLNKSLNYIVNDKKTDEGILVSGVNCATNEKLAYKQMMANKKKHGKEKGTLGFHFMQSFKPNELTDPYKAHEIGMEWAKKLLGDKYQYIISTHIDKDHIHNHIVVNSVSLDGKKFNACKKSLADARKFSDEVAKEHDLSIIQPNKESRSKSYKEWKESKSGTSWKDRIKKDIDSVISDSSSFDDFLNKMRGMGYTIKQGHVKYMTFRLPDMGRSVRGKTLGPEYEEEKIKERILYRSFGLETSRRRRIYRVKNRMSKQSYRDAAFKYRYKRGSLAVNFALAIVLLKTVSDRNASNGKVVKKNYKADLEISKLSSQLKYINEKNIRSKSELLSEKENVKTKLDEVIRVINQAEDVKRKLELAMQSVNIYQKYKPFFDEYNSAGLKKMILKNKYSFEISLFENAREKLKNFKIDENQISDFVQKFENHSLKIGELNKRKELLNDEMKKLNQIEKTLNDISTKTQKSKNREKGEELEF